VTAENTSSGATARLTVDLPALQANYLTLCQAAAPGRCGAVVKANAYGLGAVPVVERLVQSGCDAFFVATLEEGIQVRACAPRASVFVFSGVDAQSASGLAEADLTPMLNASFQIEHWRGRAKPAAIHLDTGMGRLGFPWDEVRPELFEGFDVSLLVTHLACADEPNHPLNALQVKRFAEAAARFPGVPTSIGNSAGTLSGTATRGDLCRPGIALYGGNPFLDTDNPMSPVVTLEARILQIREVEAGATVGYGATHVADGPGSIATLGVGYADGLPRGVSSRGEILIGQQRAPIVGRVSMDLTTVDISNITPVPKVGDWVEVLGKGIGVDELAAWADTIGYEVLTGLGLRAAPRYLQ
jgi:alanine racemase